MEEKPSGLFATLIAPIGNVLGGGGGGEEAKEQGIVERIKDWATDLKKSWESPAVATEVFEKNIIFLKGFVGIFFIILALVNYFTFRDIGMASKRGWMFFFESVLFGMSGVLPFLLLCGLRTNFFSNSKLISYSIALFLVFFSLNYVLEVGGFYAFTFYSEEPALSPVHDSEKSYTDKFYESLGRSSIIMVAITIIGCLLMLLACSVLARNTDPQYKEWTSALPSAAVFVIEMFLFGAISAAPIYFMAYNRKELSKKTTKEFFIITAKFAILHCLFQLSGFYKVNISDPPK